jgi:NTP pyrophosphatase (non-canonical NTP hydrolase)
MTRNEVIVDVLLELERANKIHGPRFNSAHEGWAVLEEEVQELFDEVRKKRPSKKRLLEEALQIAAMAIKFILSMGKWTYGYKCEDCRHCTKVGDSLKSTNVCFGCEDLNKWERRA